MAPSQAGFCVVRQVTHQWVAYRIEDQPDAQRQPGQLRRQPQNLAVVHQHEIVGVLDDTVDQSAAAKESARAPRDC